MSGRLHHIRNIAIVGAVILASAFLYWHLFPATSVVSPHIVPVPGTSQFLQSTHTFPFGQTMVTISVPINASVLLGARQAEKTVTIYGNVTEDAWLSESYRSIVHDRAQDGLYDDMGREFRRIRVEQNLTSDEFLELMTVYSQSFHYLLSPDAAAKFPIETAMDTEGDCDDKSLLLAGLLAHEGYEVALFSFENESHMAVGVGSDTYTYRNTGYAFLETTNYSFIGAPTTKLNSGVELRSNPIVIPIGNGTIRYHSGTETEYLTETEERAEDEATALEQQVKALEPDLLVKQSEIKDLEAKMAQYRSGGNLAAYNSLVTLHNSKVEDYNAHLTSYRQIFSQYERYARVYNYILGHKYDRKGTLEFVKNNMPIERIGI
jgi:hypothetical protein